ncbi:MAG: T9SS type A sorting domain-containing protein [Cytophagales bacterium]|nr:T9SS type A sorting domain-containing protein [Cytophagales bacterium]
MRIDCTAQNLLFERTFDFISGWSRAQGIDTTENGGYIIGSSTNFPNLTPPGIFLKINGGGDTIWTRQPPNFYTVYDDHPVKFNKTHYLFTTFYAPLGNSSDTVYLDVHKMSFGGDTVFIKKYIFPNRDSFSNPKSILLNSSNDVLIYGVSVNSTITTGQGGGGKYSIVRIDSNGNLLNRKVFYAQTVGTIDYSSNIIKYADNRFVMYGTGGSSGYAKPYLVKINNNLDTLQAKTTYISTASDRFTPEYGKILYSKSNHFYISGAYSVNSNYPTGKAVVQKLDTSLNVIWTTIIPQTNNGPNHLYELENDTILCVAMDQANGKFWFHKLMPDGTLAVPSTFVTSGLGGFSFAFRSVLKRNGQLAVCGESNKKAYMAVIQLNSRPAVVTETKESFVESLAKSSILFYPNPAKETLNYEASTTGELLLQDASGKIVKDIGVRDRKGSINILGLAAGSYTYRFTTRGFMESGKVVVE